MRRDVWLRCAQVLLVPIALAACGKEKVPDVKTPFGPLTESTVAVSTGTLTPLIPGKKFTTGVIGKKDVGGRTFDRFAGGVDVPDGTPLSEANTGTEVWLDGIGSDSLTVAGMAGKPFGTIVPSSFSVTVDPPVTVNIKPPVGVAQTQVLTGINLAGKPVTMTANYTMVAEDQAVATPMGSVSGCRHFKGDVTLSGDSLPVALQGFKADGELWYSPSLGIVAVKSPLVGMDTGILGENDWAPPVDGVAIGRRVAVLDAQNTSLSYSTYDREGKRDADMCVHCKMLAEVRWANEADAKSRGEPDPSLFKVNMYGGFGQFCWGVCPLVESPVSIFHPEDNGKGYKFWYTYIDQAVKNEYSGGDKSTAYSIGASTSASLPPIRVTMRIAYQLVGGESDCSR